MKPEEIIDGNLLIADFIKLNDGNWRDQIIIDASNGQNIPREKTLAYHYSWDCLMPVWLKILSMEVDCRIKLDDISIAQKSVFIRFYIWKENIGWNIYPIYHDCIDYGTGDQLESVDLFEALYKTVIDVIKILKNEQKDI